jgi:sucrose-6-phosphate hydrolase SacC (GH32 family)
MSWRRATSPDLLHWTDRGVAIPEREDGTGIFSGSVVRDGDRLVAVFTGDHPALEDGTPHRQDQNLAISTDGGATWQEYAGNPVAERDSGDFRDPKVRWHGPTGTWVMAVVEAVRRELLILTSTDLVHWEQASVFTDPQITGIWECPDLAPVDAADPEGPWLLIISTNPHGPAEGSGTWVYPGRFDGTTFTADGDLLPLDLGPDNYAGVTFSGVDGAPLLMAWASNWNYASHAPTSPWRGCMSLARRLGLRDEADGSRRLVSTPVLPAAPRDLDPEVPATLDPGAYHVLRLPVPEVGSAWELNTPTRNELRIAREEEGSVRIGRAPSALSALVDDGTGSLVADPERDVFGEQLASAPVPVDADQDHLILVLDGSIAELVATRGSQDAVPTGPMATLLFFAAEGNWTLTRA